MTPRLHSRPRTRPDHPRVRRFPHPTDVGARMGIVHPIRDDAIDAVAGIGNLLGNVTGQNERHHSLYDMEPFGSGQCECCYLADGFFVTFGEVRFDTPRSALMSFPDTLRIYVASGGDGEYLSPNGNPLTLDAANTVIVIDPADAPDTDAIFAGCIRYICVFIHRKVMKSLYTGSEQELPAALQSFLNGELQRTFARAVPSDAISLRCLEDVHATALEGRSRRLFIQSKAVEIVCQALAALDHDEGSEPTEATKLTAQGVLRARQLLAESYATPPSLEALAHQSGLSRSALCTGFRQIFGISVFDYIHDLRMQQALGMLKDRDIPITEIAYTVGYNHSSSFCVAIQRYFGATPTELRRRSAAPAIE
jgi:AraC-like DNA-binding protein